MSTSRPPAAALLAAITMIGASCSNERGEAEEIGHQAAAVTGSESSTQFWVDLRSDGQMRIEEVVEVTGRVKLSSALVGDYFYQARTPDQLLATQTLGNPFEQRAFGNPSTDERGAPVDSAKVLITVPGRGLDQPDYDVQVLRLTQMPAGLSPSQPDPSVETLVQSGAMVPFGALRAADIATSANSVGRKALARTVP